MKNTAVRCRCTSCKHEWNRTLSPKSRVDWLTCPKCKTAGNVVIVNKEA